MQPGTDVYELIDGQYIKTDYIKSDDEINSETGMNIRERYSISEELKLNRLANAVAKTQTPQDFLDYNTFVETCRAEGTTLKQAAAERAQLLQRLRYRRMRIMRRGSFMLKKANLLFALLFALYALPLFAQVDSTAINKNTMPSRGSLSSLMMLGCRS